MSPENLIGLHRIFAPKFNCGFNLSPPATRSPPRYQPVTFLCSLSQAERAQYAAVVGTPLEEDLGRQRREQTRGD